MNKLSLILALIGLVSALPAQADVDASQWVRAELVWSEFHGDHVPQLVLGDDPFQERLVWSDAHGDYVSVAMARHESRQARPLEMVWSDELDFYVPRATLEPCPSIASAAFRQRLAGLFF